MHVVIGTDGSADAIAAAATGLRLLAAPDSITVVCAVEPPGEATAGQESGFAGGLVEPADIDVAWAVVRDAGAAAIDRTVAGLDTQAPVKPLVEGGGAGPVICRVAEDEGADVVVVGSRGHGAIRRALLGSVSTYVSNNAPCPVVIVRAP